MSPDEAVANGTVPPYRLIAQRLRDEIRDGRFPVGQPLPTQQSLVKRFDVSRATVHRALDELRRGGLIDSQQGRGTYVLRRPGEREPQSPLNGGDRSAEPATVDLDDVIAKAFLVDAVKIDAFCLTAESLYLAVATQAKRIKSEDAHLASIHVRLLLPLLDAHLALPRGVDDPADERPLERLRELGGLARVNLKNLLGDLIGRGHVDEVTLKIKEVPLTPLFKVYLINNQQALMGYYAVERRSVNLRGEDFEVYDVDGLTVPLQRHRPDQRPGVQAWFDSLWESIAEVG